MKNKKPWKSPVHALGCRSVLTSEQANTCPLCRLRAAAPDLLSALERIEADINKHLAPGSQSTFMTLVNVMSAQRKVIRAAIANGPEPTKEQAAPNTEAPKIVPPEVKRSTFGCTNCLWNCIECKGGSKYVPAPDFNGHATCDGYTYYD